MSNSSSATKLAIARLKGSDLPIFVPVSVSEKVATLVRECILQSDSLKILKVTTTVYNELTKHLKQYEKPKYTIPQYLLMLLYTVSTTSELIEKHNKGLISDDEFINCIKNNKNANGTKTSRKMGRKKASVDASDRAVLPREVHKRTSSKVP